MSPAAIGRVIFSLILRRLEVTGTLRGAPLQAFTVPGSSL
jgi:hypothetical protein